MQLQAKLAAKKEKKTRARKKQLQKCMKFAYFVIVLYSKDGD